MPGSLADSERISKMIRFLILSDYISLFMFDHLETILTILMKFLLLLIATIRSTLLIIRFGVIDRTIRKDLEMCLHHSLKF